MSARVFFAIAALAWAAAGCASIPPGRSAIDSVRLVDAEQVDQGDVTARLATSASPKFLGLFRGVVYDYAIFDAATLQRDLARIERYYRGHGFFEAHARAARVEHVGTNHVRVEIVVDEGPPMLDRDVALRGMHELPPELAYDVRQTATEALPAGTRFDEDAYKAAQTAVARALTDRGYAYATVHADAQADLGAHAVDYTFTIHPGPPAVFGAITIAGLAPDGKGAQPQTIDEAPLRRAMNLRPGAPYSTAAIDAATQALLDLEVFSAVQIVPTLSDPPNGVVPLTVKVEPSKLHVLRIGGGFEFDEIKTELHGLFGWESHDFFGGLRDFSVDLKPGVVPYPTRINYFQPPTSYLPEERFRIQFRQPGFLEPRTSLTVRPELNVYPLLVETNPQPNQEVVGYVEPRGAIGLDRRFGKHFVASLAQNLQGEIPFVYANPTSSPLPGVLLSYPQLTTTFDFRDDPVHPHSGIYLSNDLQVAGGPFGGTATDLRVQPEVRGYVPLARGITFAARGSVGFLFASNYGDYVQHHLTQPEAAPTPAAQDRLEQATDRDIEVTYFRGFFSGGPSSNRGFPVHGIAPYGVVPFLNPATAAQQVAAGCSPGQPGFGTGQCSSPIGGFTLWEASVEVRFDVSGPFGAAVFCDSGDVAARPVDIRLDHLHLSCGTGVRYDTPVGPVRLDVGYRIDPLQVVGYATPEDANRADPTEGVQPRFFGVPIAVSFGIGEAF